MRIKLTTVFDYTIAAVLLCICLILRSTNLDSNYNNMIGILSILTIVWCGYSLQKSTKTWFSLIFAFEISYYILTLGQSFLCGIGIPFLPANQYNRELASDVNRAYLYNIMCLIAMHLGTLFQRKKNNDKNLIGEVDYTPAMKSIGIILFILTVVPFVYYAYRVFKVYLVAGYTTAYESISGTTSWRKAFLLLSDFFPFSVFMLFIAYRHNKNMKRLFAFAIALIALANFIVGNRSEPVSYLVAVLWLSIKWSENKKEKRRYGMITGMGFIVLMLVFPIIGTTRNTGGLNVQNIIDNIFGEQSVFNAFSNTISDLGFSVFPTIKTMQLIPDIFPFHYGQSYLFALLGIFPNVFGGTHISQSYAALAQWLMKSLSMTYGPGYSIPAEAFYNFGWYGVFFMPILGGIIASLLDERRADRDALQTYVLIGSFIVLFSIPRRDAMTACRNIAYYVGLEYAAVRLLRKYFTKIRSV